MANTAMTKQCNDKLPEIIFVPAPHSSSIICLMGKLRKSSIYWPSSGKKRAFGNVCLQIPEENILNLIIEYEKKKK